MKLKINRLYNACFILEGEFTVTKVLVAAPNREAAKRYVIHQYGKVADWKQIEQRIERCLVCVGE